MANANPELRRIGKTEKDHRSGAWARRLSNQSVRAAYGLEQWPKTFPSHTCNGKKNRNGLNGEVPAG